MEIKNRYGALVTLHTFQSSGMEIGNKNMGDYIQTIAGMQYFPQIDEYVEREAISSFRPIDDTQKVKVIMNAWWMWNPENWPPSCFINPLPVSMHLSLLHADEMLSGTGLQWFKEHEPIGCRDKGTVQLLQSQGIESYFSGCLTLTLGRKYMPLSSEKRSGICFTDPYIIVPNKLIKKLCAFTHFFVAPQTIYILSKKAFFSRSSYNNSHPFRKYRYLKTLMMATLFHKQYATFFSDSVLRSSEYITHIKILRRGVDTNETLIHEADKMLKYYQTCKLVVTSRIHAALPCLALETPVIFVQSAKMREEIMNINRLDGLINLFRCMQVSDNGLSTTDTVLTKIRRVGENFPIFLNKEDWKPIAENLKKICEKFAE